MDVVVLLKGARVPFVFRPTGPDYELAGDIYDISTCRYSVCMLKLSTDATLNPWHYSSL